MTLEVAIKLLNKDLDDPGSVDIMDLNKAQQLSIEGLERLENARRIYPNPTTGFLPSETRE